MKQVTGGQGSQARTGWGVTATAAAMAAVCILADLVMPPVPGLIAACGLFAFWSVTRAIREVRQSRLRLNPLVTYLGWLTATLGVSPVWIAIRYSESGFVPFAGRAVVLEDLARGHAILVAGTVALYAGMTWFRIQEPAEKPKGRVSGLALLLVGAIGTVSFVFRGPLTGWLGSTLVNFLVAFPISALSMTALNPPGLLRARRLAQACVLAGGTMVLFLIYAQGDSKMEIMFALFPALWWLMVKRVPAWCLAGLGVACVAFYLLVIAPLVTSTRNIAPAVSGDAGRVWNRRVADEVLPALVQNLRTQTGNFLSEWVDNTMDRLCDPCAAGAVVSIVDQSGLALGSRMEYLVAAVVPRMIWKDKPTVDRGREFTAYLGGASASETATTSTGQTSAGEFYWNFGWAGVIAGMFLLGSVIGRVWWGAAGGDPRAGLVEMTAYTGATLSFVLGSGAAAGPVLIACLSSGVFCRILIRFRDRVRGKGRGRRPAPANNGQPGWQEPGFAGASWARATAGPTEATCRSSI